MTILSLISFLIIVVGIFILFDMSPTFLIEKFFDRIENKKDQSITSLVKDINSNKKDNFLRKLLKESKEILENTGKVDKFSKVCILSFVMMTIGIAISIIIENYYLVPILAIGFAILPFHYIKLMSLEYKKDITQELEVSMSMITSSYIRNDNIVLAVKENLNFINVPVRNVFESFVTQSEFLNSDIIFLLDSMKNKIQDEIFHEWVDALIGCQSNRELKSSLNIIVSKLSELRTLSAEINNEMYRPLQEFFGMVVLVYINIPLLFVLNKDWFNVLMFTSAGKITLSIVVIITFICFSGVMKHTKPIDSKILDGE